MTWGQFDDLENNITILENCPERSMLEPIIKDFVKLIVSAYHKLVCGTSNYSKYTSTPHSLFIFVHNFYSFLYGYLSYTETSFEKI